MLLSSFYRWSSVDRSHGCNPNFSPLTFPYKKVFKSASYVKSACNVSSPPPQILGKNVELIGRLSSQEQVPGYGSVRGQRQDRGVDWWRIWINIELSLFLKCNVCVFQCAAFCISSEGFCGVDCRLGLQEVFLGVILYLYYVRFLTEMQHYATHTHRQESR